MGKATKPRAKPTRRAPTTPTSARPFTVEFQARVPSTAPADTPATAAELNRLGHDDVDAAFDAKGRAVRAQRKSVFELLYTRKGLTEAQYLACRRLAQDMIERTGQGDKITAGGASDPSRRAMVTDRMIEAARRIDWLFGKHEPPPRPLGLPPMILSAKDCVLLDELIEPKRIIGPIKGRWRVQVQLITGKEDAVMQTDIIRRAAQRLAESYQKWDNRSPTPQGIDRKSRHYVGNGTNPRQAPPIARALVTDSDAEQPSVAAWPGVRS